VLSFLHCKSPVPDQHRFSRPPPHSLQARTSLHSNIYLLTRSAGPVGELRMRSSVQAVALGLLLLT
jgi:hypothetical protein